MLSLSDENKKSAPEQNTLARFFAFARNVKSNLSFARTGFDRRLFG